MKSLFVINTGNQVGQILIFKRRKDAAEWLRKATGWDDQRIESEIHVARGTDLKYVTTFLDI